MTPWSGKQRGVALGKKLNLGDLEGSFQLLAAVIL